MTATLGPSPSHPLKKMRDDSTKNWNDQTDLYYLDLALGLAAEGKGLVSPNPLVGAVVVKDERVVGRGYHRYEYLKHAEVLALEEAGEAAEGGTIYINLEPCSHRGGGKRTPPCVDALVAARVARVVSCMADPNPRVSGGGFARLLEAGIAVSVGMRADAARRLNKEYVKFINASHSFHEQAQVRGLG
ncbi:MAG: diaminohydroxyphosphoribosylaminopyrimidine deaminase [Acidobacteriota bacterium]|nr:diaminohydroxyphosphoribosylaminopyrimidine deaminase [Acidobacteriota bacterium]